MRIKRNSQMEDEGCVVLVISLDESPVLDFEFQNNENQDSDFRGWKQNFIMRDGEDFNDAKLSASSLPGSPFEEAGGWTNGMFGYAGTWKRIMLTVESKLVISVCVSFLYYGGRK